jgi:preprotein translocase subunit SecD
MNRLLVCLLLSFSLVGCDKILGESKNIRFTTTGPVLKEDEAIIAARLRDHTSTLAPTYSFANSNGETVIAAKGAPPDDSIKFLMSHRGLFEAKSELGLSWFSNKDIADVTAGFDNQQRTVLNMRLSPDGATRVARLSTDSVGSYITVTLDGEKLTSAIVTSPITQGMMQITLNKKPEETLLISTILKTGVLSTTLEHIRTEVVH